MPNINCQECHQTFFQHRGRPAKRCPDCRDQEKYGPAHQKLRAETASGAIGSRCCRCHKVMTEADHPQLDHADDDPSVYIGYSCRSCNARAGALKLIRAKEAAYRASKGLPPMEPKPKTTAPKPSTTGAQSGYRRKATGDTQLLCPQCWRTFPYAEEVFHEGEWVPVPTHRPGVDCAAPEPEPAVVQNTENVTATKTATGTVTMRKIMPGDVVPPVEVH